MVLLKPLRAMRLLAPFRISSSKKDEVLRPVIFTIEEDVVAVNGKQEDALRANWTSQ